MRNSLALLVAAAVLSSAQLSYADYAEQGYGQTESMATSGDALANVQAILAQWRQVDQLQREYDIVRDEFNRSALVGVGVVAASVGAYAFLRRVDQWKLTADTFAKQTVPLAEATVAEVTEAAAAAANAPNSTRVKVIPESTSKPRSQRGAHQWPVLRNDTFRKFAKPTSLIIGGASAIYTAKNLMAIDSDLRVTKASLDRAKADLERLYATMTSQALPEM